MEKFWAVILIFVVVAAAGLMYVNQVYNPQKETQMAMADMANQTLTAVKLEIGDNSIIKGSEIEETILYYKKINSLIKFFINGKEYDVSNNEIVSSGRYYVKITKNGEDITEVRFTEIK